ncbi:MAG: nitroimidazol reductase NimA-like FMN-containing flavoprotein, partial [Arenicella sp.]
MDEIELAAEIANLLGQQAQCVLATMDETGPCQHVMAYAYSEDLFTIYLATYMDTRK